MGETMRLTSAKDGFVFDAYRAPHEDARHGGLVLVQEIFGVTDHIRELCDGFAADGYEVIAPAFYDRLEPGFEAGYDADGVARGRRYSEAPANGRPNERESWRSAARQRQGLRAYHSTSGGSSPVFWNVA
jgi:dienelactone hydrolase